MKLVLILFFMIGLVENKLHAAPQFLPWNRQSNPAIMNPKFEKKFSLLPLAGIITDVKRYWSSDYWPHYKGGINYRWNAEIPSGFNLRSPTKTEVKKMSVKELEALSPAEKFDLLRGSYSYGLKQEVARRASPRRKVWEGICHGWATAALNHNEPTPKLVANPDGVLIPFGSSDIKALLSYYYAYHDHPVRTHQMGRRCSGQKHCQEDLNAGAFHIVLSNKVGLDGKSFITDIDNGREVWNQVVHSYWSEILEKDLPAARDSAPGTVSMTRLRTKMKVVFNIVKNSWSEVLGTKLQTYKDLTYEYDLDLDKEGRIIGGNWHSKERPDFMWFVPRTRSFSGKFQTMESLLNDHP